jgi:catechol 2,3-dioxygenase-like lactoylglutathione lyase family enzyme
MGEVGLKIVIRCSDLSASRWFYRDIVGLEIVDEWQEAHGDGCVFSVGDGFLELGEHNPGAEAGPHTFNVQFSVDDVDAWADRVGGQWEHTAPKDQPWGERTVRMRDPDGILVTVYQVTSS